MDMARIRALVIWGTLSLVIAVVIHAPAKRITWSDISRSWERAQFENGDQSRGVLWAISRSPRRLVRYMGAPFSKVVPDWDQIIGDVTLIICVGGGLVFALREKRKA